MRTRIHHWAPALALMACGGPEAAPPDDPDVRSRGQFDGLEAAAEGFGFDPYGVGASWYVYGGASHTLTPRREVYAASRDGALALLEVVSYYDDMGESGYFTLRADSYDGSGWSGVREFTTSTNVKDERTCVALSPAEEVGCDDARAALVLRSSWRVVPEAGFPVREPALLAKAHFALPENAQTTLSVLDGTTLDEVERDEAALGALAPLADAGLDPAASRVGWIHDAAGEPPRGEANLHVTANMQLAHWRVAGVDGLSVDLEARCQSASWAMQQELPEQTATGSVTLPAGDYSGALVTLCDPDAPGEPPALVDTLDAPQDGSWPDTRTFDVIVEQVDGRVAIRPAPGSLLVNWTRFAGASDFARPEASRVWEDFVSE